MMKCPPDSASTRAHETGGGHCEARIVLALGTARLAARCKPYKFARQTMTPARAPTGSSKHGNDEK
jgi:hypothetical protein